MPVEPITVKVGQLPGRIVEIALNGDRTVATAIAAADFDPDGFTVRIGTRGVTDLSEELRSGDNVWLAVKSEGNE